MLSDDAIEKLVLPIAQRQERINNYIIGIIAKRIRKIGTINASDVAKLQSMMYVGGDMKKIQQALAKATKTNVKEIKNILYQAADEMYGDAERYYEYRGMSFVPLSDNDSIKDIVDAVATETVDSYINLSNTSGFIVWQGDRKIPMTIRDTYTRVVDEAIQAVKANVMDYNSAMRHSMRQMINSGVRSIGYDKETGRTYVTYAPESGRKYTRRLDSAIKQNILDGVKAINQRMQDAIGDQVGADGKEISVHRFPAPDHAPVQGHTFTNEEYEKLQNNDYSKDVDYNRFPPMERAIGMWNCRHFTFSVIIGVYPPNYTQEELNKILNENKKGYTYKDKRYTMYECTQLQRQYELDIRRAKDGYINAKQLSDEELQKDYKNKVNKITAEYKTFCDSCSLRYKPSNIFVQGY